MTSALALDLAPDFDELVTPTMRDLIDPQDPNDPIAKQFLPSDAENLVMPEELADPIGDEAFSPVKGIVHRYPDRVLLKPLHTCAVHCRFCFRREQIGTPESALNDAELNTALRYIENHAEIWEVILTGGDPLLLSPRRIALIIQRLNAIPHVKTIRLHSRIPVVAPEKISDEMIKALHHQKPVYVLLHCNHPRELAGAARAACAKLIDAGIPMLSQSVLLKGVNDTVETLTDLMRAFVENRITPYYLHHPDLVRGTSHFRVSIEHGRELVQALQGRVSGMCQPRYMLDIPGGYGKTPIKDEYIEQDGSSWIIKDFRGNNHVYSD